jgi:putative ABC transport system permease protein
MSFMDSIRSAFDALRANVMRSVLTALGIIIGVAAVIAVAAIGAGAEHQVKTMIEKMGSNVLVVINGARTSRGVRTGAGTNISLTEQDAEAMQLELDSVQVAGGVIGGSGQVIHGNTNWFTILYGVTPELLIVRNWYIASGRGLSPTDVRSAAKVALVGNTIVTRLFDGQDPVGQVIRIKRVPFKVVGVLREKGSNQWGKDQDDIIFIPLTTAKKRLFGGRRVRGNLVGHIMVKAASAKLVEAAKSDIKVLLRRRHKLRPSDPDDFLVRNISQFAEARAESSRVMSLLLASVAAISLIVGGIGIMNIMLVSVTERTREIGVRMAVGAQSRDIMAQFVIEAILLAVIGGIIGVVLGLVGSAMVARFADWPMLVGPDSIVIAFAFSAAVGIFFGYYPARKAARLDPIEALRHE